jgi:predicted ABC-type ATPase
VGIAAELRENKKITSRPFEEKVRVMEHQKKKMNLYVIAGCNGAGKTTASFTVLPEMLKCREFVNADEIAAGISPFNPEGVAIQAGRLMIDRIIQLLKDGETFAFETTLATRSYVKLIQQAKKRGYFVTLLFFSLSSSEQAQRRVAQRVSMGGHNIPADVIIRRYEAGLQNLFQLYMPVCDYWTLYDNSNCPAIRIASGFGTEKIEVFDKERYQTMYKKYHQQPEEGQKK